MLAIARPSGAVATGTDPADGLAAGRACECSADRVDPIGVESCDRFGQECLWDGAKVVEADRTFTRHPVGGSQFDFGVDSSDGASDERDDNVP